MAQPPVKGGKNATSLRAGELGVERRGALVDRGAERGAFGQRLGMAAALLAQPGDEVADGRDVGRRRHFFLGDAHGALHPGEVADLHSAAPGGASSAMWRRPVRR